MSLLSAGLPLIAGAALTAPVPLQPSAPPRGGEFALRAEHVLLADGRIVDEGFVVVEDGRIRDVGRGVDVPEDAALVEHRGWLSTGLVVCGTQAGLEGGTFDPARPLLPDAHAADALWAGSPDLARLLEAGVTTAVIAPAAGDVASGFSAVVKTRGGRVLEREAHFVVGLSTSALRDNREPTSYSWAMETLARELERPQGAWAKLASGQVPALLRAWPRHEIARQVGFATEHGLRGALWGAPLAGELAEVIEPSGLAVVFDSFGAGTETRAIEAVLALADAGVPFAFGSASPAESGAALRLSAALCVRAGLARQNAWRALTLDAARIAGVEDRVGRLERGADADLVLWSGDPLELSSAVEVVYVDGAVAWRNPRPPAAVEQREEGEQR
jgi:hypothetical protein